jgi:CheY-like chemotaxis protein
VAARYVLLIDPDRVTRYLVSQQLGADLSLIVETATSGAEALEQLSKRNYALIVSETSLSDMDGMTILRRVRKHQDSGPGFVFLSSDERKATRVEALMAHADDYLLKPCDGEELLLRCIAILHGREVKARSVMPPSQATLAGDLQAVSIADVLGVLAMVRATGKLIVETRAVPAQITFASGQPWAASCGRRTGARVIHDLLREAKGRFEFFQSHSENGERNLHESVTELLLEGARLLDEGQLAAIERNSSGFGTTLVREGMAFGPMPNPRLADNFRRRLEDPYSLGELQYIANEGLSVHLQEGSSRTALHVLLIAPGAVGARSLLQIASLPTEALLTSGLSEQSKSLSLRLELRGELELSVLLVDYFASERVTKALTRSPSFVVFVPPPEKQSSLAISSNLAGLLREVHAMLILFVGSPEAMEDAKRSILLPKGVSWICAQQDSDEDLDLRDVLVRGVIHWGEQLTAAPLGAS